MGSERNTEMDSGILYFTTILDDMWRGFKKFFLLCFLLMAVCGAVMYMREKTNYTPVYQAYSSFVVETKTAYGYNQSYSDETTAGQLSKTFPYILTSGALRILWQKLSGLIRYQQVFQQKQFRIHQFLRSM